MFLEMLHNFQNHITPPSSTFATKDLAQKLFSYFEQYLQQDVRQSQAR